MTVHTGRLAIFGGSPLYPQPLVVGKPDLTGRDRILQRIGQVLESGWLTNNGPVVREFETEIRRHTDGLHCVAVSSGTMALQIMARACGLTGEVIVPSLTFIATPHALDWIGLTPVFADVDPRTHTLDPESVSLCITPRTSAILGVHLWGNAGRPDSLRNLADEYGLKLLFDACHAFGCRFGGRSVAAFGDASVFSFHATKFVHSFEGGAVVTPNAELADQMRLMRNFGITGLTSVDGPGINGKMSEVAAAAGLVSLESAAHRMEHQRRIRRHYLRRLKGCPGIQVVAADADNGGNGQYLTAVIDSDSFGLTRDELLLVLRAEGIFARCYFVPGCHHSPPYCHHQRHTPVPLPHTERILQSVLQLPAGVSVSTEDVDRICELMHFLQTAASDVGARLRSGWPTSHHPHDPAVSPASLPLAG